MKIAVVLPSAFQGGVLRNVLNVTRMLILGARATGTPLDISFGYPDEMRFDYDTLEVLREMGVATRPFRQEIIHRSKLEAYYEGFIPANNKLATDQYIIFNDGISNFEEADLLLIASDHISADIPPHKRYGMLIYDYVQRYHPNIYNAEQWSKFHIRARVTSNADFVITTTQQTKRDAVSYAGVKPERAFVLPIEFDIPTTLKRRSSGRSLGEAHSTQGANEYVLWPTIISEHENHLLVLDGLERFLQEHRLQIIVTGSQTNSFDPSNIKPSIQAPHIEQIRNKIRRSSTLRNSLIFEDYVEDQKFWDLMQNAACILHSSTGDNGSYTLLEAAWLGTQTVSSRYPAMEEVARSFDLSPSWFSPSDPKSLAVALNHAVHNLKDLKRALPSQDTLSRNRYDNLAPRYWQEFSMVLDSTSRGCTR